MEQDWVSVTLFSAMIAALLALLVYDRGGFSSGMLLLIALVSNSKRNIRLTVLKSPCLLGLRRGKPGNLRALAYWRGKIVRETAVAIET